jgi:hypothetical protein
MNQPSWTGDPFYFTTTGNVTLPGDTVSFTYSISLDGVPMKSVNEMMPPGTYLGGRRVSEDALKGSRVWKGDDATYYVMELDQYAYREAPCSPGQTIHLQRVGATKPEEWVVREIVADFRKMVWTVSCIDAVSWEKSMRLLPGLPFDKPPQFASIEQADAWLEAHRRG